MGNKKKEKRIIQNARNTTSIYTATPTREIHAKSQPPLLSRRSNEESGKVACGRRLDAFRHLRLTIFRRSRTRDSLIRCVGRSFSLWTQHKGVHICPYGVRLLQVEVVRGAWHRCGAATLGVVEESDGVGGVEHGVLLFAPEVQHLRRAFVQKGVAGARQGRWGPIHPLTPGEGVARGSARGAAAASRCGQRRARSSP